jgi:hypothetical protein
MLNPLLMAPGPKIDRLGRFVLVCESNPPAIPMPTLEIPNSYGNALNHAGLKLGPALASQPNTMNDLAVPGCQPSTETFEPPQIHPAGNWFVAYAPLNTNLLGSVVPGLAVRSAK